MNKFIFSNKKTNIIVLLIGIIFSLLSGGVALLIPLRVRVLIDNQQNGLLNNESIIIILLFIIQAVSSAIASYLLTKYGEGQVKEYRKEIFNSIIKSKVKNFDNKKSGELASRVVNDTSIIRNFITTNLVDFSTGIIIILGSLLMLFLLDWRLSSVMFVSLPLMMLIISPLSSLSGKYGKIMQDYLSELTGYITESVQQIRLIKTSTAERDSEKTANILFEKTYKVSIKSGLVEAITKPLVFFTLFAIITIIFSYGGQRVAVGTLTVGTLVTFLIYLFQLLTPISQLGQFFTKLSKVKGATKELNALLELEPEKMEGQEIDLSNKTLFFDNVSFSYSKNQILKGVSLEVPANHKVAIVGPSGSGKSTIVNLIERLYDVEIGQILIDGKNISAISLDSWRKQTAIVSQDIALFSGSLYDNLIFGLHSKPSIEEVNQAVELAAFKEDVDNLENGLETIVGERGMKLSGGQRQRLQIARAFLRKPKLLILDEATSNLDSESEEKVISALSNITENKTTLSIAHRLSTIVDSDRIYFLENGEITGVGSHDELYRSHNRYRLYVNEQMLEVE